MKIIFFTLLTFLSAAIASGQEKLLSVCEEHDLTVVQGIDSVICEFGVDIRPQDADRMFGILKRFGRKIHCASVTYRTEDPGGNEVVASGLIAFSSERKSFRGVVEIAPYNREKRLAGTVRRYTTEVLLAVLGYIVLIPDTIGYGATEFLTIPYVLTESAVRVASDMRRAAVDYFRRSGKDLPEKTFLFGYSLGAPTALALSYFYMDHPEFGARVRGVCLGSGAYDPDVALEHSLEGGRMGYLIYPGIVRSLNDWKGAGLDESKLFCGPVLEDFDRVSDGSISNKLLTEIYGDDLHSYMHPDFFTPGGNAEAARLREMLSSLAYPFGHEPFPLSVQVVIRHSAADDIVPVECSDELFDHLKGFFRKVVYHRDRKGTHYEVAVRSFLDLAFLIL